MGTRRAGLPPMRFGRPLASRVLQAAVGVIVTASFFPSLGSGIVTSTTPSCVFALDVLGLDARRERHRAA
jgi:hypothetical protein